MSDEGEREGQEWWASRAFGFGHLEGIKWSKSLNSEAIV